MIADGKCRFAALAAVIVMSVASLGCLATRKYVQTQAVVPLQGNIKAVDQKVDSKTNELDQRISDVDRHAEQGVSDATDKANTADQDAQKAGQSAQGAQQTADKGVTIASQDKQEIDNIDNYQAVKTQNVLFGFNHANLTPDDQQELDDLTQNLATLKHYAVEVEGFTDQTGPKQYNLELSRRRADSVVRYLTEKGNVPLVKIHVLGLGEDEPLADNTSVAGRKQNRRVQVRIMAPQVPPAAEAQTSDTTSTSLRSSQ